MKENQPIVQFINGILAIWVMHMQANTPLENLYFNRFYLLHWKKNKKPTTTKNKEPASLPGGVIYVASLHWPTLENHPKHCLKTAIKTIKADYC